MNIKYYKSDNGNQMEDITDKLECLMRENKALKARCHALTKGLLCNEMCRVNCEYKESVNDNNKNKISVSEDK